MRWLVFASMALLVACLPARAGDTAQSDTLASPSASPAHANAYVQTWFTQLGGHPDVVLATGIDAGKSEIDAAFYAINRSNDVNALAGAQARCKCVRLISDAGESKGASQIAALTVLRNAGVPIKIDTHTGIMHLKLVVIDKSVVYEGSFNDTNAASTVNDEVLFRVASTDVAQSSALEFDRMWNDMSRFTDWNPNPATPASVPEF